MTRRPFAAFALSALLLCGSAWAQQGARVTVTSTGKVTVEPDRYEYRVQLRMEEGAEGLETGASALASRLRETLLAENVASGGVAATVALDPVGGAAEPGETPPRSGDAVLVVSVSSADAGAPNDRIPRLLELRRALEKTAEAHVAESAEPDRTGLDGPLPALADDTAARQAAIGSAVKASAADAEAAAAALQGRVVSAESVEVGAVALKWGDESGNDRLRFQGEIVARAKVTYLIGPAR